MVLEVTSGAMATLLAEAARAGAAECCGLLLGAEHIARAQPAANVAPDPARCFEIDPAALIAAHREAREGGEQIIGYYHSHPNGGSQPSATDRAAASGDGRVWAIVAAGGVSIWRDGKGGFEALSYSVVDR